MFPPTQRNQGCEYCMLIYIIMCVYIKPTCYYTAGDKKIKLNAF